MRSSRFLILALLIVGFTAVFIYARQREPTPRTERPGLSAPLETATPGTAASPDGTPTVPESSPTPPTSTTSPESPPPHEPVSQFRQRITKKSFGTYIDPATSPVQPERFRGFHTGVDVEFEDTPGEIPVAAIAPGSVTYSQTVSGYGGVTVIRHSINGKEVLVLYGHLDPADLLPVGRAVARGETIGRLGEGNTPETDGERKHLHLAVLRGPTLSLKGYVDSQAELSRGWQDPLELWP
jgi:murein DD-endopeptidase MepM/ murein hydrolase activator NlpD